MNLDDVAAELRERQGAQSVDVGLLLGRRFWGAILRPWLILVVPILIAVQVLVAVATNIWVAVVVGWWLKPLFDRLALHVVSRGFFGAVPSTMGTVKTVLGQWWSLDALADLTWRRLSPSRSLTMPVRILEGNARGEVRDRLDDLYGDGARLRGMLLTGLSLGFKSLLYVSMLVLVVVLLPDELLFAHEFSPERIVAELDERLVIAAVVAMTTVATTLVEPFYVAGGFGLYIERRIRREGWDLEIRFRRLADRLESVVDGGAALLIAAAGCAIVAAALGGPVVVHADEGERPVQRAPTFSEVREGVESDEVDELIDDEVDTETDEEADGPAEVGGTGRQLVDRSVIPVDDPSTTLDEIIGNSPFSPDPVVEQQWVPIEDEDDEGPEWLEDLMEWTIPGVGVLATVGWGLMWLLAIGALVVVVIAMVRRLGRAESLDVNSDRQRTRWEEELLGANRNLVLPDDGDVIETVQKQWERGERREALATMLLSSLVAFEDRYDIDFPAGWTTMRCAQKVRGKRPEGPLLFELARVFGAVAWAGRSLSDEEFEELCRRWASDFATSEESDA